MTRFAWFVLLFFGAAFSVRGQEVIVFSDHRSLVVTSHREQGIWTYLRMDGGEIAVKTNQITQIRKEGAEAQQSARAAAAAMPSPSAAGPSTPPPPPAKPTPPPPPDADDGDKDEEEPPAPAEGQPPTPPRGMGNIRANLPPAGSKPMVAPSPKKQGETAGVGR